MHPFSYHRAESTTDAIRARGASGSAKFIGGGTNLIDLMKENVERPDALIDLNTVRESTSNAEPFAFREILRTASGGLSIGAGVTNADTAYHPLVREWAPLVSDAILAGASPQLRNMATCGGNLLQRTRCPYFYDRATACNKREPGSGCDARLGWNRNHAVLGYSDACIATHPSDFCVALAALGATVHVVGASASRAIPFAEFHRLPGDHPERDSTLAPDELIHSIEIPAEAMNLRRHFHYLKVRDRASYAFALVSTGVALELDEGGTRITRVHAAIGGVAHKPWRDRAAEGGLTGRPATPETFRQFAEAVFAPARGFRYNEFKIELGKRTLVRALEEARLGPSTQTPTGIRENAK